MKVKNQTWNYTGDRYISLMKAVYIDVQNVHMRTIEKGRRIDRQKFFVYLIHHIKADKIYYVVGYLGKLQGFYDEIESYGYTMLYKNTGKYDGEIKGNVDIDIAIQAMYDLWKHGLTKAYLISNDGDYNTLLEVWQCEGIFGGLILPDAMTASRLIKRIAKDFLDIQRIRHIIEKQKNPDESGSF